MYVPAYQPSTAHQLACVCGLGAEEVATTTSPQISVMGKPARPATQLESTLVITGFAMAGGEAVGSVARAFGGRG